MSSIEKLMIRGIRSFDPDTPSVIDFFTPLTIIVGHNGSGKTTIIECLKYATTGELPPNSKGGAFIHDPKLFRAPDTKAQIKLKFNNVNRQPLICTRSMQLTITKTKSMSQKTLENLLVKINPNDPTKNVSLSTRCADLDLEIPIQLGVSKAILQNVIFCHQEESNWPLAEPAVVKKKFDEIFASSRYTKALDSIKAIRKDQTVEIKLDQQHLSHIQENRSKAERVRLNLMHTEEKLALFEEQTRAQDKALREILERITALKQIQEQVTFHKGILAQLQNEVLIYTGNLRHLKQNMTIMGEPIEEIKRLSESQEDVHREIQRETKLLDRKVADNEAKIAEYRTSLTQLFSKKGRVEAEIQEHTRQIGQLAELLHRLRDIYELELSFIDPAEASAEALVGPSDQLTQLRQVKSLKRAQLKKKNRELEVEIQAQLAHHESMLNETVQKMAFIEKQKATLASQVKRNTQTILNLVVDGSKVQALRETLQTHQADLAAFRAEVAAGSLATNISETHAALQACETRLDHLNREMRSLSGMADRRAKLALLMTQLESQQLDSTALLEQLAKAGRDIPDLPSSDPKAASSLIGQAHVSIRQMESDIRTNDQSTAMIQAQMAEKDSQETTLRKTQAELKVPMEEADQLTKEHGSLFSIQRRVDDITVLLNRSGGSESVLKLLSHEKSRTVCCPLCRKSIKTPEEDEEFDLNLNRLLIGSPQQTVKLETELDQIQGILRRMKAGKAAAEEFAKNKGTLLVLQSYAERAKLSLEEIVQQTTELDDKIGSAKTRISALEGLVSLGDRLATAERAVNNTQVEVDKLKAQLASSGSTLTFDECQSQAELASAEKKSLEHKLAQLNRDQVSQQEKDQSLKILILQVEQNLQTLQFQLVERQKLEAESALAQRDLEGLCGELKNLQLQQTERNQQLLVERETLNQHRESSRTAEEAAEEDLRQLSEHLLTIRSIRDRLSRFIQDGVADHLRDCLAEIGQIETHIAECEEDMAANTDRLADLDRRALDLDAFTKQLRDNIEYHEYLDRITHLETKIQETEATLAQHRETAQAHISGHSRNHAHRPGDNPTTDWEPELAALQEEHAALTAKGAGIQGEMKQLQAQRRQYRMELDTDFPNVDTQFRDQLIKFKTTELANQDLDKYAKALDTAIMKFHSLKMAEINKIIRDLWMHTYQGNDIDTIEIRSDCENARGNRSYNYRVVMIKQGIELDMRGRSSAGQRVLACLIIRLGLAESFGTNCGILALDEPTTNLDQANIESLADGLSHIIRARRQQHNFQLIVITHDESFVELLGRSDYTDHYWRVFKNEK
ncbi:DNA repair protein rad50 [Dimargaris cristalligena]|nr:DNA repair protein rad50 [Dimargaris cristalligena]